MTPPAAPRTTPTAPAHESDAFQRVGGALIRCWARWQAAGSIATTPQQRNELLDETGSDFRPLVDLLLDLGHSVRPSLQSVEAIPLSASAWDTKRAPLVHQIVSTRYLQPDVARWAIDVWGLALGVSPPLASEAIASPVVRGDLSDTPMPASSPAGSVTGATRKRASALPPVLPLAARPSTTTRSNAPSWAGGPVALGVGAKPKPGTRQALAASGRLVGSTVRVTGPRFQPIERIAGAIILGLLLLISVSLKMALSRQRPQGPAAPAQAPAVGLQAPAGAPEALAPAVVFDEMVAAHSEALVPLETQEPLSLPSALLRERGVAGRYRVTQRIRSVDGSESCVSVAQALGVGRTSDERITHTPGSDAFRLDSRSVAGTLDADGAFVAGPVSGTLNNIPWTFRMRGQFLPNGFTGESQTFTQAIIRWGRTQSCVVTATLDAVRLPG